MLVLGYVQALIWPVVALTIALLFRAPLRGILLRLQHSDLPGRVSLNFQQEIELARVLAHQVARRVERIPHADSADPIPGASATNEPMRVLGFQPSPSALNFAIYHNLVAQDPQVALAGIHIELEIMLGNMSQSFTHASAESEPAAFMVQTLRVAGVLSHEQSQLIQHILRLCTFALHGQIVSLEQAYRILDAASVVHDYYVCWLAKHGEYSTCD